MILPILVIDNNDEVYAFEKAAWEARGYCVERVCTMQKAAEQLMKKLYFFVVINADNINYKPLLSVLSDMSRCPILIFTTVFTASDQTTALLLGADGYAPFQNNPDEHIDLVFAQIKKITERKAKPREIGNVFVIGSIIISPFFRKVFCNDKEIEMTTKEFNLLNLLIDKPGYVYTYEQIYAYVWDVADVGKSSKNAIWTLVRRLRNKLRVSTRLADSIIAVKGVGYCFTYNICSDKD